MHPLLLLACASSPVPGDTEPTAVPTRRALGCWSQQTRWDEVLLAIEEM